MTLDHLKPHSKGGSNDAGNLVTACRRCNSKRGSRGVTSFARAVAEYIESETAVILRRIARNRARTLKTTEAKRLIGRRNLK